MLRRSLAALLLGAALLPGVTSAALPALRIGVSARVSPRESYAYYDSLLAYLGTRLGRKVEMVQYTTYSEMDSALERLDLDFAFICAGSYARDRARFGPEVVVAPEARGAPFYYAYTVVPLNGPAKSLADLRGKRFAFTDPGSNTGWLVPTYLVLREFGVAPEAFFGAVSYTWSHDRSIDEVNAGRLDGASVDSLIFDYLARRNPQRVRNVRILARSAPFGAPPFVATRAADPRVKTRLREILLSMHQDAEGKKILDGIMIDRFVVPPDSNYDSVRDMETWVRSRTAKARR